MIFGAAGAFSIACFGSALSQQAMPLHRLVPILGAEFGKKLDVHPQLSEEIALVVSRGKTPDCVLAALAEACHAKWIRTSEGLRLTPDVKALRLAEENFVQLESQAIRESLRAELEPLEQLTVRQRLAPGVSAKWALLQLLRRCPVKQIARLKPGEFHEFQFQPIKEGISFSPDGQKVLREFLWSIELQAERARESLRSLDPTTIVDLEMRLLRNALERQAEGVPADASRITFVVKRPTWRRELLLCLRISNESGVIRLYEESTLAYSRRNLVDGLETSTGLPKEAQKLLEALMRHPAEFQRWSESPFGLLRDPTGRDPLELFAGPALRGWADHPSQSIVAVLPDTLVDVWDIVEDGREGRRCLVENWLQRQVLEVRQSSGIYVLRPTNPDPSRNGRACRSTLRELVRFSEHPRQRPLDLLTKWASRMEGPSANPLLWIYFHTYFPDGARIAAQGQAGWSALRFLGRFRDDLDSASGSGSALPVTMFGGFGRSLIRQALTWSDSKEGGGPDPSALEEGQYMEVSVETRRDWVIRIDASEVAPAHRIYDVEELPLFLAQAQRGQLESKLWLSSAHLVPATEWSLVVRNGYGVEVRFSFRDFMATSTD